MKEEYVEKIIQTLLASFKNGAEFYKPKYIFDMDGCLWGFDERVCERIGLEYDRVVTFHVSENPLLDDEEKQRLRAGYMDPNIFENIIWYDGADRIRDLVDNDAYVGINSNCGSEKARDLKDVQIVQKFPFLDYRLNLIEIGTHKKKQVGSDIDVFIDDNPHNIADSDAKLNIMPRKPWNTTDYAKSITYGKNVIQLGSLNEVIDFLETYTKIYKIFRAT